MSYTPYNKKMQITRFTPYLLITYYIILLGGKRKEAVTWFLITGIIVFCVLCVPT